MPQMSPILWYYMFLIFNFYLGLYVVVLWFSPIKTKLNLLSPKKCINKLNLW